MKKRIGEYFLVIIGVALTAFGLDCFLIPNKIAAGGVSGISTIIYHLTGFPVGISMLLINIPLFIIGGKVVGRSFFIKTLVATIILSAFIDLINIPAITNDITLATVYGGVICGAGLGLVIYSGSTTGGTDMAAKIIHQLIPRISVPTLLFIIDFFVVIFAAFVFDTTAALYAVAALYITSKIIDVILQGYRNAKAYLIISNKSKSIKNDIIGVMDRGVTVLKAIGGYTNKDKNVILCVIRRNAEVIRLKEIVKNNDKDAFMMAINVTEVLGEGFDPHI